jgi:hypothetical protein
MTVFAELLRENKMNFCKSKPLTFQPFHIPNPLSHTARNSVYESAATKTVGRPVAGLAASAGSTKTTRISRAWFRTHPLMALHLRLDATQVCSLFFDFFLFR